MEIYKTYLRENSSTVMIEHYPLESLPQILNHANDMDFVWIDVDAIQRFQQEVNEAHESAYNPSVYRKPDDALSEFLIFPNRFIGNVDTGEKLKTY